MPSKSETIIRDLLASADIHVNGSNPWDIQVHDPRFYNRVLREIELEREGILYTRPGLGVFVAARAEQYCHDDRRATIRAELEKTVAEGQRSGLNARELRKLFAETLKDRRAEDTKDR